MIEEAGTVVALESGKVWVETIRQSSCNSCTAQKGCGHSVLEKIYEGRRHQVLASSVLALVEGDEVILGIPEDAVFKGSFILYLVPILSLMCGMWVAGWLANELELSAGISTDLLTAVGALMGIGVGVLLIKRYSRINKDNADYMPVVMRRTSTLSGQPIQFG